MLSRGTVLLRSRCKYGLVAREPCQITLRPQQPSAEELRRASVFRDQFFRDAAQSPLCRKRLPSRAHADMHLPSSCLRVVDCDLFICITLLYLSGVLCRQWAGVTVWLPTCPATRCWRCFKRECMRTISWVLRHCLRSRYPD